ncbi:MAG: 5-formyltetrahydrofolate cyclo-ligase [Pseudomonadota bacterium]
MDKKTLRSAMRLRRRQAAGHPGYADKSATICQSVIEALADKPEALVAGYMAQHGEPDLAAFQGSWPAAQYLLPRVTDEAEAEMDFASIAGGLESGPFDVSQPLSTAASAIPNIILVPLLAFDAQGGRLGQGGGYYDRALAKARSHGPILAIGVAFAFQKVDAVPTEPHDAALDAVVTEHGLVYLPN